MSLKKISNKSFLHYDGDAAQKHKESKEFPFLLLIGQVPENLPHSWVLSL
jgi:hypothetical protein